MRILYIADGRSPNARSWIEYFTHAGYEVHLASTFPCQPVEGLVSLVTLPVALSEIAGQGETGSWSPRQLIRTVVTVGLRTRLRQLAAPLFFPGAVNRLGDLIEQIQPDLIHAMRIPYEGMIASLALKGSGTKPPLLISVWGNDFTLHAKSTPLMAAYNRQALEICDALHIDCQRDLNLARRLGFAAAKPSIIMPAAGGVKMDIFYPTERTHRESSPVTIINPRGFRSYVRNDTFFKAIPVVLSNYQDVRFVCPGMAGEAQAEKWVKRLGINGAVKLLPFLPMSELAALLRISQIELSISTHDGTPNSLVQAMACGCFPIAGDIESIREWITSGVNGLLVDPGDPAALASAILEALSHPDLRRQAMYRNLQLVHERAEYRANMHRAEEFCQRLVERKNV